jgi:mono/diheme cytochrome c family protein
VRYIHSFAEVYSSSEKGKLLVGLVFDVTDRKQAKEALMESEEKYRELFHRAQDAILLHGVAPDGQSFIIMPSAEYYWLSDADLAALIAYLNSLPPVDNSLGERSLGPVGRMLVYSGAIPLMATIIDHTAPRPEPEPGVTVEYGSYLAAVCLGCHGPKLDGQDTLADPAGPPPTDLTSTGPLSQWTEEEFINTMRSGTTPYGKAMDPFVMPWTSFGQMNDDELKALWLYLQSLPAS